MKVQRVTPRNGDGLLRSPSARFLSAQLTTLLNVLGAVLDRTSISAITYLFEAPLEGYFLLIYSPLVHKFSPVDVVLFKLAPDTHTNKTFTMKARALRNASLYRAVAARTLPTSSFYRSIRSASSISQRPESDFVSFPGALKSAFTNTLQFQHPQEWTALPTYRVVDQNGTIVDPSFKPDIPEETIVKLYTDMVYISILDVIMFDAQRQGRLSFYMVSAGEEAVPVGSSSVLDREDVIFCQYREQGCFRERGFTTRQFMAQLFANREDSGRGRNMPIHYGCKELNIVGPELSHNLISHM